MKIIHCADIHLDSKMNTRLKGQKQKTRISELISSFASMVDYASKEKAKAVIIAGDLFDSTTISKKTISNILNTIENHKHITFFYLSGNHDEEKLLANEEDLPVNFKMFGSEITSYEIDNVVISGVELSLQNYKSVYDEINLDKSKVNIFTLHGQIDTNIRQGKPYNIPIKKLKNKNIDYLALGHIHSYSSETLDDDGGVYVYSGCLEGTGFDDLGKKGFVEIEIVDKKISHKFIENSIRTYHIIEVDISEINTINKLKEKIKTSISNISSHDFIRLVLTGEVDKNFHYDKDLLIDNLHDEFYYVEIKDNTRIKIDIDLYKDKLSIQSEFIKMVEKDIDNQQLKNDIIKTAILLLDGQEVDL